MDINDLLFIVPIVQVTEHVINTKKRYSVEEFDNKCIVCGVPLGVYNMRQYCEKTYCPADDIFTYTVF